MNLILRSPAGQTSEHSTDAGLLMLGGGEKDQLKLEGAPPEAVRIEVGADCAIAEVQAGEVVVGKRTYRAGDRRLLRPSEKCQVFGHELSLSAPPPAAREGTLALALGVLAGALQQVQKLPMPSLVWLNGKDCGKRLPLTDEAIYLGRGNGAAARVRDEQASRRHAKLVLSKEEARLVDLGSANGVLVDGEPIEVERRLFGGEILQIGETELAFEAELKRPPPESEQAPAPQAEAPAAAPSAPAEPPVAELAQAEGPPEPEQGLSKLEFSLLAAGAAAAVAGAVLLWLFAR